MQERASARDLLAVHKAATGNARFAAKAEQLVISAAELLDGHHGSASGLPAACMAPPADKTKGKGKGQLESYEQKTTRLKKEIADASAAQDATGLPYLWRVLNKHEASAGAKPTKPTTGKGASKGSFAASNQSSVQFQTSVAKAVAVALKERDEKTGKQQEATDKAAEKKRLKLEEQEQRKANGNVARPCRLCLQPNCYFNGTYQTSMKCFLCKIPFDAPIVPTPTPLAAPPQATPASAASLKASSVLDDLKAAAVTHLRGYADVAKAAVPLPTPPPAPVRPAAAGAPAVAPAPQALQPGAALVAPQPTPAATTAAQAAAAAELETAKKLNDLRTQRNKAASQLDSFQDVPDILAALQARIAQLDALLLSSQAVREAALEPHQLAQVLTQRQQQASEAAIAAQATKDAADSAVNAFDAERLAEDEAISEFIRGVVATQAASQQKAVAARADLVESLKKGVVAAHDKAAEAKRLLEHAQSTHNFKSGVAQAAAAEALAQQQAMTRAQEVIQQQHAKQQELLRQQLADSQTKLSAQAAELAKQSVALRPAALQPVTELPEPMMPEGKDAAEAMYSLRASLHQLAEQESPVLVAWGDLSAAHLHWADVCKLVPHHVIAQSAHGIDPALGPSQDDAVPSRVIALLRKQLDAIVAQWCRDNTSRTATAEALHSQSPWAQSVLDHALRIRERKRPADSSAETANSVSKATPTELETSAIPIVVDEADAEVPPTQLDGTPTFFTAAAPVVAA